MVGEIPLYISVKQLNTIRFEETYNDILIDDIISSLDELLDSKVLPEY